MSDQRDYGDESSLVKVPFSSLGGSADFVVDYKFITSPVPVAIPPTSSSIGVFGGFLSSDALPSRSCILRIDGKMYEEMRKERWGVTRIGPSLPPPPPRPLTKEQQGFWRRLDLTLYEADPPKPPPASKSEPMPARALSHQTQRIGMHLGPFG